MPDILTPSQRHRCMSHIRSKAKKMKKLSFQVIDFGIFCLIYGGVLIKTHQHPRSQTRQTNHLSPLRHMVGADGQKGIIRKCKI